MSDKKLPIKIAIVSGTRADYGHLYALLKLLKVDADFDLHIIVTAMHLSQQFGKTVSLIEKDGFEISERVEMFGDDNDTASGVSNSLARGVSGFAEVFTRLKPDLVVVFGDRFEMLAAAQAAMFCLIPSAHIGGGDVTEGVYDENIRHALTKLSHLHFATNKDAQKRICQLGEDPSKVFCPGSLCLDLVKDAQNLTRSDLESRTGYKFKEKNIIVTFHPVTLSKNAGVEELNELLAALSDLPQEFGMLITKPNMDVGGHAFISRIEEFASGRRDCMIADALGHRLYHNFLREVDLVIGNSSSGIYEAPALKRPSINIGDRQKGRIMAASVICCKADRQEISDAISKGLKLDCRQVYSPYGEGFSAPQIINELKRADLKSLIPKKFFDL